MRVNLYKNIINNKLWNKLHNYNQVIKNTGWLFLIQVANYIFPIVTLPYMMRVLGTENYGMIVFAQAIMQYVNVISDYGFNLTATREIAIYRRKRKLVKELFNDVLICKLYIMTLCFIILVIVEMCIPLTNSDRIFYLVSFLLVVGNVIFPIWFFQGIEQMKYITFINLVARMISMCLLFVLVKNSSDYLIAIAIQGIGGVISGVLALILIYNKFGIYVYRWPKWERIIYLLKDGKEVFISNACGNIYGQGATLLTGIIAGNTAAAYYSLGQKISAMVVSVVQPIAQAVYPYLCQLFLQKEQQFYSMRKQILTGGIILGSILAICLFFLAKYVSYVITGKMDEELIWVIKLFSIVTMGTILNVLLHPMILAMKKYASIQKIYVSIAVLFIFVSLPLVHFYGSYGMSVALIMVEFYIFVRYMLLIF